MNLNGSVTPQTFSYTPRVEQVIQLKSLHITISSSGEPALSKFGGIAALDNGVHFRIKNNVGRDNTYWTPIRSNNSFRLSGFSYDLEPKLLTTYYLHMSINLFDDSDSAIELDGSLGQSFEAIVQDDLTGLSSFEIKLGIHEELQ
jgi:hypothetical protein